MVNIQIQDAVAAALNQQARAQGLSLEQFLAVLSKSQTAIVKPRISGEEFEGQLDELSDAGSGGEGTFSREVIYQDHD